MAKHRGSTTELFLVQPRFTETPISLPPVGTGNWIAGDLFRYYPGDQSFGSLSTILTSFTWEVVDGISVAKIYWDPSKAVGPIRVQFAWLFMAETYYQDITTDLNPVVLNQLRRVTDDSLLVAMIGNINTVKTPLAIRYCPSECLPPLPSSGNTQLFVIPVDFLTIMGGIGQGDFSAIQLLGGECPLVSNFSWTVVDGLATLTITLAKSQPVAVQFDLLDSVLPSAYNQYLEAEGSTIVLNNFRDVVTNALYPLQSGNTLRGANLSIRPLSCCCKADSELWEIAPTIFEQLPIAGGILVADIPTMTKLIPTGRTGLLSRVEISRVTLGPIGLDGFSDLFQFAFVWPRAALGCLRPVSVSIALSLDIFDTTSKWQELEFHTVGVPVGSGDEVRAVTRPLAAATLATSVAYATDYTKIAIRYSCCFDPEPGCERQVVELVA